MRVPGLVDPVPRGKFEHPGQHGAQFAVDWRVPGRAVLAETCEPASGWPGEHCVKRRGYTIIEALVVVAVAALLISISVLAISGVRGRSNSMKSLANLRSNAQVIATYVSDSKGIYPRFTEIGAFGSTVSGGGLEIAGLSYFDAHKSWHIALADVYYDARATSEALFPPGYEKAGGPRWPYETGYFYPCSFIARPEFWNLLSRTGPQQFGSTSVQGVVFPANKTLFVQHWFAPNDRNANAGVYQQIPSAFCDGSASEVAWSNRLEGYPKGDGYEFQNDGAVHFVDSPSLLHTIDGVRGRDVR